MTAALYFHAGRWITWAELQTLKPGLPAADISAKRLWVGRLRMGDRKVPT